MALVDPHVRPAGIFAQSLGGGGGNGGFAVSGALTLNGNAVSNAVGGSGGAAGDGGLNAGVGRLQVGLPLGDGPHPGARAGDREAHASAGWRSEGVLRPRMPHKKHREKQERRSRPDRRVACVAG